jgi:hypothetical protein
MTLVLTLVVCAGWLSVIQTMAAAGTTAGHTPSQPTGAAYKAWVQPWTRSFDATVKTGSRSSWPEILRMTMIQGDYLPVDPKQAAMMLVVRPSLRTKTIGTKGH